MLSSHAGLTCNTGNGSKAVSLPGINRERIIGVHRIRLVTGSLTTRCAAGPGTFISYLPATVIQTSISTPQG
jgi:hypothetical protein